MTECRDVCIALVKLPLHTLLVKISISASVQQL